MNPTLSLRSVFAFEGHMLLQYLSLRPKQGDKLFR